MWSVQKADNLTVTSQPSIKCRILAISEPYEPPCPVTGIVLQSTRGEWAMPSRSHPPKTGKFQLHLLVVGSGQHLWMAKVALDTE
jgi:hypothetical protein